MKAFKATLEVEKISLCDEIITTSPGTGKDPDQGEWD